MKALIFNGAPEQRTSGTAQVLTTFLTDTLHTAGMDTTVFHLPEAGIPFFDGTLRKVPLAVTLMAEQFKAADIHIWLTPLYHGSMAGAMKNCLDWLEITAKDPVPYLTDKVVGLVSWADGERAIMGIVAMEYVAKALRAWTHPYTVPILKNNLYTAEGQLSADYTNRLRRLVSLLVKEERK